MAPGVEEFNEQLYTNQIPLCNACLVPTFRPILLGTRTHGLVTRSLVTKKYARLKHATSVAIVGRQCELFESFRKD